MIPGSDSCTFLERRRARSTVNISLCNFALFFNLLFVLKVESSDLQLPGLSSVDTESVASTEQLNLAASMSECDPLPFLPFDSPVVCDQVKTIGLGATGSTFVSYVLGEIGSVVGWKNRVLHDHSRQVYSYNFCSLAMMRDFRDIVCSTLKRKENCMKCSPKTLTAKRGVLKGAYYHNFPNGFLDELYTRHARKEITVIRYGNIYPIECAQQFFGLWVPKYFGLESLISVKEILEIVNKYSIEMQKKRVEKYKAQLTKRQQITWKDSITIPGLSGSLHINHIANDGIKNSWKKCFTERDNVWLTNKLKKHLIRFNYSLEI